MIQDAHAYRPEKTELKQLGAIYWEVWKGLPNVEFFNVPTEAGSAWQHRTKNDYIWVPPDARAAYEEQPDTIFLVMLKKAAKQEPVNTIARWVCPQKANLEESIEKARTLNREHIREQAARAQKARSV